MKKSAHTTFLFGALLLGSMWTATLTPAAAAQPLQIGSDGILKINITINASAQSINTIQGKLSYPTDLLKPQVIDFSGSAVPLWIDQPKTTPSGEISFSGAIPGGVQGESVKIFSIVFGGLKIGTSEIKVENLKGMSSDGRGTEVTFTNQTIPFSISQIPESKPSDNPMQTNDTTPPEPFNIELYYDESSSKGQWVALFYAVDKESGIDYYEVLETKNPDNPTEAWVKSENTYTLKDQSRKSYIVVKAVDGAGNTRIAKLEPQKSNTTSLVWFGGGIALLAILYAAWRKIKE